MSLRVERRDPASLGLARDALEGWVRSLGPVAVVDLETTGLPESRSAEILEIGIVLLAPGDSEVGLFRTLIRPRTPIPPLVSRLTGLVDSDVAEAPELAAVRACVAEQLAGRVLVAHQIGFERAFLSRDIASALADARALDTQEILGLTHPDAPDLRLETFTRRILGREERHRALDDALDAACVLGRIAAGARDGQRRYVEAGRIVATHLPDSPWRALLEPEPASRSFADLVNRADAPDPQFVTIGASAETPVPFEVDAIVAALADAERGQRHFPEYRVRDEQLELAREFVRLLRDGGVAKLEGGTGVGKSLAYLSAAIPFAMERAAEGSREPVLISTRTKLLQDQLLHKDIAAAARFLGYPELRALSIKGRANYVCERRLGAVLAEARDPALLAELRGDYAMLEVCARIRPQGEIGTVPAALLRRHSRLRELLRASVAARAEQCSREQCGHERRCPFGRHRQALSRAQLVVANHDLLLRWPPDYPRLTHVIMDEGHEVGGVAEEVFALRVRPEEINERLEELFGALRRRSGGRPARRGLVASPSSRQTDETLHRNRRDLALELTGLGRTVAERADGFGGVELPPSAGERLPVARELAESAAQRLDALAREALAAGARPTDTRGGSAPEEGGRAEVDHEETERSIAAHAEALQSAAHALRVAFGPGDGDHVGAFEGLETPYDRWSLVLRPIAPGESFHTEFLEKLDSLAIVSATLFVDRDAYAALGEIGLGDDSFPGSWSRIVGSPFPYDRAMRIVALEQSTSGENDLVEQTAQTLAILACALRGRTLGLFTSLTRMRQAADRLSTLLAGEGIEVLLPRRSSDDPGALVERFQRAPRGAVLLGARRFWQGIDVRGEDLQAVVIEKLPFDVPTELRRRREERLRAEGGDPFVRSALGHMLLHLKQMAGRLIRSETDRGLVVIVDARRDRGYFRRLQKAFPEGTKIEIAAAESLPGILAELGLGLGDRGLGDRGPGGQGLGLGPGLGGPGESGRDSGFELPDSEAARVDGI